MAAVLHAWHSTPFPQPVRQRNSVIVCLVLRSVEKSHPSLCRKLFQLPDGLRPAPQFVMVVPLEFLPEFRFMPEPLAQIIARRDLPQPEIKLRLLLGQAPRPKPVDKDARAVRRIRRIVHALYLKVRHDQAHSPLRMTGTVEPSFRMPSTSTSPEPIIQSMWMKLLLPPRAVISSSVKFAPSTKHLA